MDPQHQDSLQAAEFRKHFDQYYLGVVHRLLNEDGIFLAFVSMLTAMEVLAGVYRPQLGSGDRFKAFVSDFFPSMYGGITTPLWKFRNKMIHSFNPGTFSLVCHASRMHLCQSGETRFLNAEDFYADLLIASRQYFVRLYADLELQKAFKERLGQKDGGAMYFGAVNETVEPRAPAV